MCKPLSNGRQRNEHWCTLCWLGAIVCVWVFLVWSKCFGKCSRMPELSKSITMQSHQVEREHKRMKVSIRDPQILGLLQESKQIEHKKKTHHTQWVPRPCNYCGLSALCPAPFSQHRHTESRNRNEVSWVAFSACYLEMNSVLREQGCPQLPVV